MSQVDGWVDSENQVHRVTREMGFFPRPGVPDGSSATIDGAILQQRAHAEITELDAAMGIDEHVLQLFKKKEGKVRKGAEKRHVSQKQNQYVLARR